LPTAAESEVPVPQTPQGKAGIVKARMLVALVSVASVISAVAAGFADGR
jgi:hypothetical protein